MIQIIYFVLFNFGIGFIRLENVCNAQRCNFKMMKPFRYFTQLREGILNQNKILNQNNELYKEPLFNSTNYTDTGKPTMDVKLFIPEHIDTPIWDSGEISWDVESTE